MKDLDVVDLYERLDESYAEKFLDNVQSTIHTKVEYEKVTEDTEWIQIIEDTLPYIDNIFRNPNRFIVNEEEIVKIELARKITVESIKHLSKNTNLIQDIDKKTGDVKPSKILNINKEESYNTYENRLIYTLVQNTKFFVSRKKKFIEARLGLAEKNNKSYNYKGTAKVQGEVVDIEVNLNTKLDGVSNKKSETELLMERIKKLEEKIVDVSCSEVYKTIDKLHITLVTPPIKKTNVVLKNVNFQYAMKLWTYLQENIEDNSKHVSEREEKDDNEEIKRLVDETFLLDYLISRTLVENEIPPEENQKVKNQLTTGLIQRIISLNPDMPPEEFKQLIGDKYEVVKRRNVVTMDELQDIFKNNIDKYLEKLK